MDDLKLYASSQNAMAHLHHIVERFSTDIVMSFGLNKCAVLTIEKGKVTPSPLIPSFPNMDDKDWYRYLRMMEGAGLDEEDIKNTAQTEFWLCSCALLKIQLHSRNLSFLLTTFALPVLQYTFGIVEWMATALTAMDQNF